MGSASTAIFRSSTASTSNDETFWRLHDRLVTEGGAPDRTKLAEHASAIGLGDRFERLAGDPESLRRVRRDLERAREAGVRRAPTLFVNGRYLSGLDGYEALRALVRDELENGGYAHDG